jgi:hypothetical protein
LQRSANHVRYALVNIHDVTVLVVVPLLLLLTATVTATAAAAAAATAATAVNAAHAFHLICCQTFVP